MSICASAASQRAATSCWREPELQRAEGDVVEHGRAEQLDVRVLKDQPDLAVEAERVLPVGHGRDVAPQRAQRAARSAR